MCIHATLECFSVSGAIKKPRRNVQCADPITGRPCRANSVGLADHEQAPSAVDTGTAGALAVLDEELDDKS